MLWLSDICAQHIELSTEGRWNMQTYMPTSTQTVSPEEYMELVKKDAKNIKRSRFIPPRLGKKGFGKFEIEYKTPRLLTGE